VARSLEWADREYGKVAQDADNPLRQRETAIAIRKPILRLLGSRVQWKLKVRCILADGTVVLHAAGVRSEVLALQTPPRVALLPPTVQSGATLPLKQATKLNPGDDLAVVAVLTDVCVQPNRIALVLSSLRAAP
jgi:hypothetical protein